MAPEPSAVQPGIATSSRLAESAGKRAGFIALGHLSLGLAVVGAVLPVMPTTVFLIAAASCYARGSSRFHRRLLANRVFGPVLRDWEAHRAMSRRAKTIAIGAITLTFGLTIAFAIHTWWIRLLHVAIAGLLIGWILRIRTR